MATTKEIQYHYDVDNNFYKIFLDKSYRIYSCADWEETNVLEQAQKNKLSRICRFANINDGDKLLDIGCGWGGGMEYALDNYNLTHATGLTLSNEQCKYINSRSHPKITALQISWQDYKSVNKFDSIISIGAFEHFASRTDRIKNEHIDIYRSFFSRCSVLSKKDSSLGMQTIITERQPKSLSEIRDVKYLLSNVFPGSTLPSEKDIKEASENIYSITNLRKIGRDYTSTLAEWKNRLNDNKEFVVETYGKETFIHYIKYFDCAIRGFDAGLVNLAQYSFRKQ